MIKDRMSNSAKKYFEPLLKIADEKEQKVSQAVSNTSSNKLLNVTAQLKAKSAEELDRIGGTSTAAGTSKDKKGTASRRTKQILNPSESSSAATEQKPLVASTDGPLKSANEEKTSKRPKAEKKPSKEENVERITSAGASKKEPSVSASSTKEADAVSTTSPAGSIRKRSKTPEKKSLTKKEPPAPQVVVTSESSAPVTVPKEPEIVEDMPSAAIRTRSKTPEQKSSEPRKANALPEVVVTVPTKTTSTLEEKSFTSFTSKSTGNSVQKKELTKAAEAKISSNDKTDLKQRKSIEIADSLFTKPGTAGKAASDKEKVERKSLYDKNLTPIDVSAAKPPRPTSPVDSSEKKSLKKKESPSSTRQQNLDTVVSVDDETSKSKSSELRTRGFPSDKATASNSTEKAGDLENSSLKARKSSAPEAIITTPPKKTVLGAPQNPPNDINKTTPIRMQRFGSSESGDSTKENQNVEEKKPTRQGALRKKEKPTDNLEMISPPPPPPPPSPSKPVVQPPINSMSTLLRKRQSINDVRSEPQKESGASTLLASKTSQPKETAEEAKTIAPRPGSVQERLQKLNGRVSAPIVNMAVSATSSSLENKVSKIGRTEKRKGAANHYRKQNGHYYVDVYQYKNKKG
ncbi:hypothetical protein OSTOST_01811 [Ostertagia ostertagi]